MQRSLDPTDAADGLLDRNGDGESNLAEYFSQLLGPGTANVSYVMLVQRILSGELAITPEWVALLDTDDNDQIDRSDLVRLRRWITESATSD